MMAKGKHIIKLNIGTAILEDVPDSLPKHKSETAQLISRPGTADFEAKAKTARQVRETLGTRQ